MANESGSVANESGSVAATLLVRSTPIIPIPILVVGMGWKIKTTIGNGSISIFHTSSEKRFLNLNFPNFFLFCDF